MSCGVVVQGIDARQHCEFANQDSKTNDQDACRQKMDVSNLSENNMFDKRNCFAPKIR
jgi:hypothetical protein